MPSRERIIELIRTETRMFCQAVVVLLAVATIAGSLGRINPYLDWFASFRHLYLLAALVPFALLFRSSRKSAATAAVVIGVNAMTLVPWTPVLPETCQPQAQVLSINALGSLSDHDVLVEMIARQDPEVVFISELVPELEIRVAALYPYHVYRPEYGGVGLFTKYPVASADYIVSKLGNPQINALVSTPDGPLRIIGAHPFAPFDGELSTDRNEVIELLADAARSSAEPVLLAGDLNVTMFSPNYSPLDDAGLINARLARGVNATWPSFLPFRIPIDHILHTSQLSVCDVSVGESFESDHLPLTASIAWAKEPPRLASRE